MNRFISATKLVVGTWLALVAAALPPGAFGQNAALDAMLKRFDSNGNGQLDPTEVPSQYRAMIDRAAKEAGMDTTKPLSIERLKRAAGQGSEDQGDRGDRGDRGGRDRGGWGGDRGGGPWGGGPPGGAPWGGGGPWGGDRGERDRERERERRRNDRNSQPATALVPGFGSDPNDPGAVLVPGFGEAASAVATSLEDRFDERVLRNVDRDILGEYDHNRNGSIDPDEWREVPWGDDPRQDDKNRDGKLTREELAGRIARRWGFGDKTAGQPATPPPGQATNATPEQRGDWRRDDRGERGDRGDRNRDERRRGEEEGDERWRRGGPGGPGGGPGGSEDEAARTRSYAMGLIRQYDADRDGFLTPEEWKDARTDVRAADRNNDNRVDAGELAAHLLQQSQRNRPAPSSGGGQLAARDLRFDTAHERLPKGTPTWFVEKDANADGQVAMAEYSTTWNDATVAEFGKYDGNDDGVITPFEAMNPQATSPSAGATATGSAPSRSSSDSGTRPDRSDRSDRSDRRDGRRRGGLWGGN